MQLTFDPDATTGQITITMTEQDRTLLAEDIGLPILMYRTMEAIIALRSGARPAGTSTEAGNWADMIHQTSMLLRNASGVLDAEIRAHAAAKGSHGQLARALGVPRSTAQSQREVLLAKDPSQWEPRRITESPESETV